MSKEGPAKAKYGTVVKPCNCKHAWEDKRYGKGNRLHNLCQKGAARRCCVCGKETSF